MVIVLEKGIPDSDKRDLKAFLERNNFRVNEITGEEDTIFGAVGHLTIDPREVEILPGVSRVIPISKPYKMASREFKRDDTIVEIPTSRGQIVRVGGLRVVAIAGPCAVEDRDQIMSAAEAVSKAGAVMLRGGAYKPRTSPYAFQGLGEEGIKLLREAGDAYGLPIVTEIVSADHIPVMKDMVDVFQVGARNMQNFELLKKVGALKKPVILKRGISATIEEWLMAAEYLLSSGTDQVILCERGIRTYEKATRNTLDLSAIPVLRSLTHLPIIVDPSHAVGIRDKVSPMALAAIAAGADGIIVEVHCNPDKALSDGPQSLYPVQFEKLMNDIDVMTPVISKELARLRKVSAKPVHAALREQPEHVICAFSGARGAYAQQAIEHYFDPEVRMLSRDSFRAVFQSVLEGKAQYGMIPIENSLAGSVYENYDNLLRFEDISIVGSIKLRIEHVLVAPKGASLESIKNVYSHPQALGQCDVFLEKHPQWNQIECLSTATAAQTVAALASSDNAAIASSVTAKINKLQILQEGLESDPHNFTRFIVIAASNVQADFAAKVAQAKPGDSFKASLVFTVDNKPGALYAALGIFQKHGMNLARLESRPVTGHPWTYLFYADVELAQGQQETLQLVLQELRHNAGNKAESLVRLLGIYSEK